MRQIRESLRLHLQAGLSYNEVGRALRISKSAVGKYVSLARVAGVDWDLAQTLDDQALQARLYRPALPRSSHQLAPDFGLMSASQMAAPGPVRPRRLGERFKARNAVFIEGGQVPSLLAPAAL